MTIVFRAPILWCALGTAISLAAGACGGASLVPGSTSPIRVLESRPCAQQIGAADGVSNSYDGNEMVPRNPIAGLICRYAPSSSFGQTSDVRGSLYAQLRLTRAQAVQLAGVIDAMSTAVPPAGAHCPAERPSASIIAFAYAHAPDVDLWYKDSGCATLDNGRISASEIANPAFDGPFESLIAEWAPAQP